MTDITNKDRAGWAKAGLKAYSAAKDGYEEYDEAATVLTYFLCDLMHFAERGQIDFQNCLDVGRMHYTAECAEPGNPFGLVCPTAKPPTGSTCDPPSGCVCAPTAPT